MGAHHEVSGVPIEWWNRRYAPAKRLSFSEEIRVVNPVDIFCDRVKCLAGKEGVSYYFDDDHLSVEGAHKVALKVKSIISQIGAANL